MKYTLTCLFSCICNCRRSVSPFAVAAVVLSGLSAVSFLGGCAHPVQPLEPSADRIERSLATAVRAASDVSGIADIAMRAMENAEACRISAMKQLAGSKFTNSVERVAAERFLRDAEKASLEAGRMALEAAGHAGNVTNAVAAMKKLAGQAAEGDASQTDKIVTKMQKLGGQCVKEAAAARKLSDELKKKWLTLSSDAMLLPSPGNSVVSPASNSVPATSGP